MGEKTSAKVTSHEHYPYQCNRKAVQQAYLALSEHSETRVRMSSPTVQGLQLHLVPSAYGLSMDAVMLPGHKQIMASQCYPQASLIGQKAAELLALPGYSGRVLAVVSSAIYLAGDDGEVLWLGQAGLPAHRRCILSFFHAEHVEAGMGFVATDKCLRVGHEITIDLTHADRWMPPTIERALAPGAVNGSLEKILAAIQHLPPRGLGYALELITRPAGHIDYSTASAMETTLLNRAEPLIRELITACRIRDMERVVRSGLELAGLGPGLTPSGDDYLGGLLFSAHHLKAAYHMKFEKEADLLHEFLNKARPLTNRVSHTILSDLAHGHGPEPLHDLISLLLQGSTRQQLLASVKQLIRIGHTSGWDMLAGTLTGMLLRENIET